jgi:copper chaperone
MDLAVFKVDGMHCEGCADRIRTLLGKEPGVRAAVVSFAEGSAEVRYNPHTVSEAGLREIIETGGFHVRERPE